MEDTKQRGHGGESFSFVFVSFLFSLIFLQNSGGAAGEGWKDRRPSPLCFDRGFMWTFPGNQDVAVK